MRGQHRGEAGGEAPLARAFGEGEGVEGGRSAAQQRRKAKVAQVARQLGPRRLMCMNEAEHDTGNPDPRPDLDQVEINTNPKPIYSFLII